MNYQAGTIVLKQKQNKKVMQIEIWSDVVCPFCYIGKKRLEEALAQFPDREKVKIVWRSFQLDPQSMPIGTQAYGDYLKEKKGMSEEQLEKTFQRVSQMGKSVGIDFHFEKAIVANSYHAHRLLHLAKSLGVQNEAKELLLKAHFNEGENIADHATLLRIGKQVGIAEEDINAVMQSNQFAEEVDEDLYEAYQVGVRGVPFFVFDRKFAISGAQETALFLQTLEKANAQQQA